MNYLLPFSVILLTFQLSSCAMMSQTEDPIDERTRCYAMINLDRLNRKLEPWLLDQDLIQRIDKQLDGKCPTEKEIDGVTIVKRGEDKVPPQSLLVPEVKTAACMKRKCPKDTYFVVIKNGNSLKLSVSIFAVIGVFFLNQFD